VSEFKGTKGPVSLDDDGRIETEDGTCVARVQEHGNVNTISRTGETFSHADGELICEAFNVLHETNMTPRALAERVAQLESQVEDMMAAFVEINALHPMELNMSNYDVDDVAALNENASNASVIAYNMVKKFKPETAEVKAE